MTQSTFPHRLRATGAPRTGVGGTWWQTVEPDGTARGLLRLDPAASQPGVLQRLAATIRAVNALRHAGLLVTGEPIRHEGSIWLVAAEPAGPTVVELASSGATIDTGQLATIASETAQALLALHATGLVHGAVHGQTVVVAATGVVRLAETGLAPVLRPARPEPVIADRHAWAELVRWLAGQWAGPGPAAEFLLHCAARGEQDLAGAVRLLQGAGPLPTPGPDQRAGLAAAVARHQRAANGTVATRAVGTDAGATQHVPTGPARTDDGATQALPGGDDATLAVPDRAPPADDGATHSFSAPGGAARIMPAEAAPTEVVGTAGWPVSSSAAPTEVVGAGRWPAPSSGPPSPTGGRASQAAGTLPATEPGAGGTWPEAASAGWQQPGPTPLPPGGELRFGPGVPAATPTTPGWRPPPTRRRRSPWRVASSVLSALLTIALLAVAGFYLWQRINPLEISSVSVTVPQPPGNRCDVTVDVVGTVQTNGNAGTISYQWLRTGAAPGSLLTERVGRGQRAVTLHLRWSFAGVGSTQETATLNVTAPAAVQGQVSFRYDCRQP